MDQQERIDMLREAQKLLYDVAQMIEDAVDGTPVEHRANAYIIPHLQSWIEDPYQSANIEELINDLESPEDDEE